MRNENNRITGNRMSYDGRRNEEKERKAERKRKEKSGRLVEKS